MTGNPSGGRVLVVVPSEVDLSEGTDSTSTDATGGPDGIDAATDRSGDFLRGGRASASSGGDDASTGADGDGAGVERTGGDGAPRNRTDDETDRRPGDEPKREDVVRELKRRLSAEVVVRCPQTTIEYVEELGPTIDCVVVLWENRPLIDRLISECALPTIVFEPPVIGRIDEIVDGDDPVAELLEVVRIEIRHDRVQNDLQESNARLTALSHYAEDITACETVEAVVERTVEATTDALAFDYCVVLLAEGDLLVPRASTLPEPPASPCSRSEGIAGRTLARGESEIVPDMQTDPDAIPEHDELHAVLSVPIDDRGVIQVVSAERDAFDDRDREFVEILAGYTREALQRIEREVTLREERDRLHAFFGELPTPAIYVERRDGTVIVEEANRTYADQISEIESGQPLSEIALDRSELDYYERAFESGSVTNGSVERERADGEVQRVALSVVPVSPPTTHECAYGLYIDEVTTRALESFQ
ncbi:GAF domain-containing protein [Halobellus rufus]|uniref:GAF domain-containing protein n=1 Tax=Halobellus rufus TaxID=1448860 RepID=UPI000679D6C1|nr:GAF domain-containing protein [Halobellus rufus]